MICLPRGKNSIAVTLLCLLTLVLITLLYVHIPGNKNLRNAVVLNNDVGETRLPSSQSRLHSASDHAHTAIKQSDNVLASSFSLQDLHRHYAFTPDSPLDVLVFIHIQKTGGTTFGKNLINNLDVKPPCQCDANHSRLLRCPCYSSDGTRQWLYSRYSTGWMCGLHAGFTEWTTCLAGSRPDEIERAHRNRRFLMFTIIREPLSRYISEYLHVRRGATWSASKPVCNGKEINVPFCFEGENWYGVNITEFTSCEHNLAHNRQTRMLADLTKTECNQVFGEHNPLKDNLMLRSAKDNLKKLAFFGISERLNETEFIFEQTFNLKFKSSITISNLPKSHGSAEFFHDLPEDIQSDIITRNDLDIQLYQYALELFVARYKYLTLQVEARQAS